MKPIKVVQIGIGHAHAVGILRCMLEQPHAFDFVGLALPPEEMGKYHKAVDSFVGEFGMRVLTLDEVFADDSLDGAVIETEERLLCTYAIQAARRGLHIHMDKPGGFAAAEFEELAAVAKEKDLVLSLGYMYRFNPCVNEAVRLAKSGALGQIYSVEAQMSIFYNSHLRPSHEQFPGGMLYFLGCHLLDMVCRIQGLPEEVIPCSATIHGSALDLGMAVLRYPRGTSFVKTCALEPGGFMRRQLVVCGDKGTLVVNPLEEHIAPVGRKHLQTAMRTVYASEDLTDTGTVTVSAPFSRYDDMMLHFAAMVRGEERNAYSYEYEAALHRLVLQACGML